MKINSDGNVIQDWNDTIVPQFLTGKSKLNLIQNHIVYSKIYEQSINALINSDWLLIIGYSYNDVHINKLIKDAGDNGLKIININPYVKYPFRYQYTLENITNLNSISDLSDLSDLSDFFSL